MPDLNLIAVPPSISLGSLATKFTHMVSRGTSVSIRHSQDRREPTADFSQEPRRHDLSTKNEPIDVPMMLFYPYWAKPHGPELQYVCPLDNSNSGTEVYSHSQGTRRLGARLIYNPSLTSPADKPGRCWPEAAAFTIDLLDQNNQSGGALGPNRQVSLSATQGDGIPAVMQRWCAADHVASKEAVIAWFRDRRSAANMDKKIGCKFADDLVTYEKADPPQKLNSAYEPMSQADLNDSFDAYKGWTLGDISCLPAPTDHEPGWLWPVIKPGGADTQSKAPLACAEDTQ
ncbi:uncharacterized protein I303_106674 [Kwoniella dejecticola CBS 10117]|uniref:Uncharacterized protein n=1 Tax=Kwoniella dejecticola CBS 10117 TaxID=1296121 RepID=A0A1A5ZU07_9TREE|nr:uncharacterized protein I303_08683 [Kwoniella dejecticola CBS 10117]OBR81297.1 hypothetical protein I303_08683 [Kwoniella dejecticola CBS 10117]